MSWSNVVHSKLLGKDATLYKCNKCLYLSKSDFFMKNHVRRFHGREPRKPFDCSRSDPETFYCLDCNFKTTSCVVFSNHIRVYKMLNSVKKEEPQIPEAAPDEPPVM